MPAAAPAPALSGATLTPASVEAEFRERSLTEDARIAGVLMGAFTLLLLAFVRSDLAFLAGTPALGWILGLRALHLAGTALALLRLRRGVTPTGLDRIALGWSLSTSALDFLVLTTRPQAYHLPVLLGTVMVAGTWTLLPNRFRYQGLAASAAVLVEVVVLAGFRDPLPGAGLTLVASGLGSAFLGGGWVSWRLHGARRRAFLELKRAEAARDDLARAATEIRTLRGLVPICASCKAMRTPDGRWAELEEVLGRQTEAEFTHGICDRCLDRLYPER